MDLFIFKHFPSLSPFFINLRVRAEPALLPICAPAAILLFILLLRKQNGGAKKIKKA